MEKVEELKLNDKGQVTTTFMKARCAFADDGRDLFEYKEFMGKDRYDLQAILGDKDSNNYKLAKKAVTLLCEANGVDINDLGAKESPLRDGNKNRKKSDEGLGEVYDGFENMFYLACVRHARTKTGKDIPAPKVYASDKSLITSFPDPRIKEDGAFINVQGNFYFVKEYGTVAFSHDFVVYRNDEFTAFEKGASIQNEDNMFDGTGEPAETEDDI